MKKMGGGYGKFAFCVFFLFLLQNRTKRHSECKSQALKYVELVLREQFKPLAGRAKLETPPSIFFEKQP